MDVDLHLKRNRKDTSVQEALLRSFREYLPISRFVCLVLKQAVNSPDSVKLSQGGILIEEESWFMVGADLNFSLSPISAH